MAVAADGGRVVPHMGDTAKNGAYGATANRAEVSPYSAGRRAPACVSQDGESLGPGGSPALSPYPGWPSTLPRCRDPGAAGSPVRPTGGWPAAHVVSLTWPTPFDSVRRDRDPGAAPVVAGVACRRRWS